VNRAFYQACLDAVLADTTLSSPTASADNVITSTFVRSIEWLLRHLVGLADIATGEVGLILRAYLSRLQPMSADLEVLLDNLYITVDIYITVERCALTNNHVDRLAMEVILATFYGRQMQLLPHMTDSMASHALIALKHRKELYKYRQLHPEVDLRAMVDRFNYEQYNALQARAGRGPTHE
jgi:hypothetical protein